MLLRIFILCLLHLALASPVQSEFDLEDMEQLEYHFNEFKVKHNRSYTAEEEILRFQYFKENLAKINERNRNYDVHVHGINKFTDWSAKELQQLLCFDGANLSDYGSCSVAVASDISIMSVSGGVDWREKNAVSPAQDQGTCGSCWAFSAAALLEGAYALKHNTLLKLSEQQFVDCDQNSLGCQSGYMHTAISSTMQLGGQELEQDYPYINAQQQCLFDASKAQVKATSCKVFLNIGDTDDKLASLLASTGPLSIGVDATALNSYHGGLLHDCDATAVNHAVSLVGYGDDGGVPYWIIKNSWGPQWGENGFVRVKRGVGCIMVGTYVLTAEVE